MRSNADICNGGAIGNGGWRHPDEVYGVLRRELPVARARPFQAALATEAPALQVRALVVRSVALLPVRVHICPSAGPSWRSWRWHCRRGRGRGAVVLIVRVYAAIALPRQFCSRVCRRNAHVEYSRLRLRSSVQHVLGQLFRLWEVTSK